MFFYNFYINRIHYEDRKETGKNADFKGPQGLCPYCHTDLLKIAADGTPYCPQCNVKATVEVDAEGKLKVILKPEDVEKSRWGAWGQKLHMDNIGKGHAKAAAGKDKIKETYANEYLPNVAKLRTKFPELEK